MQTVLFAKSAQEAINGMPIETVRGHYPYLHEIVWYGVEAVAHVYLFSRARRVASGQTTIEQFAGAYGIKQDTFVESHPPKRNVNRLTFGLEAIANDVFIPDHKPVEQEYAKNRSIWLLSHDYRNRMMLDWKDWRKADELVTRGCSLDDLKNPEIVERGVNFGREMWQSCILGFNSELQVSGCAANQHADMLISYYDSLVAQLSNA